MEKKDCVLKKQVGVHGDNFILKKEEITPRLGGSTDVLLIYGQSFLSSKNGPG
jgi:hypothetical protein